MTTNIRSFWTSDLVKWGHKRSGPGGAETPRDQTDAHIGGIDMDHVTGAVSAETSAS